MALRLDTNTLEMIQFSDDAAHPAILCENFSWLLKNLHEYDPAHVVKDKH